MIRRIMTNKRLCACAAILMPLVSLSACGDDDDNAIIVVEPAKIRVINLSPDARNVEIYVRGYATPALTDLAFMEGTPYLGVPAGTYTFDVVAFGVPPAPSVLSLGPLPLEAGKDYTAAAFDELASIQQVLALADDNSNPGSGNIRIRPIHAASAVGQVDIWNMTNPPALLYANVDFGNVGPYAVVPAASYTLGFDINDDGIPELEFTTGDVPQGSVLNVFAVSSGADVFLLAQFQDGTVVKIDPNQPTGAGNLIRPDIY